MYVVSYPKIFFKLGSSSLTVLTIVLYFPWWETGKIYEIF